MVPAYAQVFQGMSSGRGPVIMPPQTPQSNLTLGTSAKVSVGSTGPMVAILTLAAVGLVLAYVGTRGIQGLK